MKTYINQNGDKMYFVGAVSDGWREMTTEEEAVEALLDAKANKIDETQLGYIRAFLNGFDSQALGIKIHIKPEDQQNYIGAIVATQSLADEDILPLPLSDFTGQIHIDKTVGQARAGYLEVVNYKAGIEAQRAQYLLQIEVAQSLSDLEFEINYGG